MYALIENGQVVKYPYSANELKQDNPQTSYPSTLTDEVLARFGVVAVAATAAPTHNEATHGVRETAPEQVSGAWRQKWETYALSAQEAADKAANKAAKVREIRNEKLSKCDWTQVADAPVDKAAWATYRQALRDVTAQAGFPWEVQWPTEP